MTLRADGDDSRSRHDKQPTGPGSLDSTSRKLILEDFLVWQADGGSEGGLNRPVKVGPARRALWAKRLFDERLEKWGLHSADSNAENVRERFIKLSRGLPESSLEALLQAAEFINRVEKAKAAWNPKTNRLKYRRLSRLAISAAILTKEIAEIFPSPWAGQSAPIGALVGGLVELVHGTLMATTAAYRDRLVAAGSARKALRSVRELLVKKTGKTHWALVRDLVWLASGTKGVAPSERTIRRYLVRPGEPLIPEKSYWNRHWPDLVMIEKLVPIRNYEPFESEALSYLNS